MLGGGRAMRVNEQIGVERDHRGCRNSAARFLAAIKRSSGKSTVVFIREGIFPFLWEDKAHSCPSFHAAPRKPQGASPRDDTPAGVAAR